MTELAVIDTATALTSTEVQARVNRMQEVMQSVMKEHVHYGRLPGTDKPGLWKPGAEVIMATFQLAADPQVEDLSTADAVKYRVKVNILTATGAFVGAGIGECSSDEDKYCWRRAVCDEEYDGTDPAHRRNKWSKGKGGSTYQTKQIRTNPADLANTVLKMAKKRALVDAVLTATSASDIFAQDIEDIETVAEYINQNQQDRLRDAATKLMIGEPAALAGLGLESWSGVNIKDLPETQKRLVAIATPAIDIAIRAAASLEDLDTVKDAMNYYPSGTPTRDLYAAKARELAGQPQEASG